MSRMFATIVVVLFGFLFIISFITFLITELIQGSLYLAEELPKYVRHLVHMFNDLFQTRVLPIYQKLLTFLQTLNLESPKKEYDFLTEFQHNLTLSGMEFLQTLFLKIASLLSMLPYSLTVTIVVIIATFLITKDWPMLQFYFAEHVPIAVKKIILRMKNNLEKSLFGYIKAQFILLALTAIILFIGLSMLRIEHSITITLLITFVDLLPVLGIGTVFIPWIIYLFIIKSFPTTIGLCLLYIVIIVFRQMIEPKVLAENIGLHPLLSLMILFFSVQAFGMSGFFLAPVLFIIISACYQSGMIKMVWDFIKQ